MFATGSIDAWEQCLRVAGVPCAPVLDLDGAADDPQTRPSACSPRRQARRAARTR
jgi:crotonobetainyl-CoA:carnitine CoA-transferase CaiB-like acyl-CoA transferase